MIFEAGVTAFLKGTGTVIAEMPGHVYPVELDFNSPLPALTFDVISPTPIGRPQVGPVTLKRTRLSVAVWDKSYLRVAQLAAAIEGELDGWRGQWGSGADSIRVDSIQYVTQTDDRHEKTGLRRRILDFYVFHSA